MSHQSLLVTITSDVLPAKTQVRKFYGKEQISQLYRFVIDLIVTNEPNLDMLKAINGEATLQIHTEERMPPFHFHGLFASVEQREAEAKSAVFRAELVPHLFALSLSEHSRVFVDQSVPDIIEAVFKQAGVLTNEYRLELQGTYEKRQQICQYYESDLAFVSRLMEREGIYYFFEQGTSRETLVITDHTSTHKSLDDEPVHYRPGASEDHSARQALSVFSGKAQILPSKVSLTDYDYHNPKLDVSGSAPVWTEGSAEVAVYGENFSTPADGKRLAQTRAQAQLTRQQVFRGRGRVFNLRPGYTFTLDEYPNDTFNVEYLVTSLEHTADVSGSVPLKDRVFGHSDDLEYIVEVSAIPQATQFRPPRRTPKPRVHGMEIGVVDGAADSDYAQLNDDGCYKVKLNFDENDQPAGEASLWVRMLQPHGGTVEGCHFPLRKGTEVMISFQGGDPDRPFIAGMLPNSQTPSPVTKANETMNVLQSGGSNRIELEDKSDQQHVRISTPPESTFLHLGHPNTDNDTYNVDLDTAGDGHVHT